MTTSSRVFVWFTSQDDNLGDIVLRRRLLEFLDRPGVAIDLYVGVNSPDFVDSLVATIEHASITLHRNKIGWVTAMVRAGRVTLVTNLGEIRLDTATIVAQSLLLGPQLLLRVRGGDVVRAGTAVRDEPGLRAGVALTSVKLNQTTATLTSWRDGKTPRIVGSWARVTPDWAFSPGPRIDPEPTRRDDIFVTFRSDRGPLGDYECRALRTYAARTGRTLTVFVQVRRDEEAMAELAGRLEADFLGWPEDRSHAEQERAIRARMRTAAMVVSDRIHALIVGTTEGALPAGVHWPGDDKTALHFAAAGLPHSTFTRTGVGADLDAFLTAVEWSRAETLESLTRAAADVDNLGRVLTELVAPGTAERTHHKEADTWVLE